MEKANFCEGTTVEEYHRSNFRGELSSLLNKHSIGNACCTPEFILAEFIDRILKAYEGSVKHTKSLRSPAPDTAADVSPNKG